MAVFPTNDAYLGVALQRYATLLDVADLAASRHEPVQLLRDLIPRLRATLACELIEFSRYDPSTKTIAHYVWDGNAPWPKQPLELSPEQSAAGWVWKHQQVLAVGDLEREESFTHGLHGLRVRGMRSYCVLPLTSPHQKLGALGVASANLEAYGLAEQKFLLRVGQIIALSLDAARAPGLLREVSGEPSHTFPKASNGASCSPAIQKRESTKLLPFFPADSNSEDSNADSYKDLDHLLADYFASSTVGLCILDSELRYLAINKMLADMDGIPASAHLGKSVDDVLGDVGAKIKPELERVLATGKPVLNFEITGMLPTASAPGHWLATYFPIHNSKGGTKRIGVAVMEISEPRRLHESLRVLTDELEQEQNRLQVLRDIDAVLASERDLSKLIPSVYASLHKALPHDQIGIDLYDKSTWDLPELATFTDTKEKLFPDAISDLKASIAGQVFAHRKTRVVNFVELANLSYPSVQRAMEQGVRSVCCIPLITSEGATGVLLFSSNEVDAFQKSDVDFLEQVAAALAQAVQNATAHKALLEERQRLQVLLNVSVALAPNWNVTDSFARISAHLRRVLRHECAFISLYDEKNHLFVRQAQDFPLGRGLMDSTSAVISGGPQAFAVAEQRPVIFSADAVQAFRSNPALVELANSFLGEGLKSMCCIPLLRPKGALGALTLASTREKAFSAADAPLLHQVASQLALALENARIAKEIEELNTRLAEEKRYLEGGQGRASVPVEGIIGDSAALHIVLNQVATVAGSDATALILGETGTGKELIARAIHRMSSRRERGFIKLNCAAIPTGLLESELFGHEKGAFTGAVAQKVGRLELADKGTLFLDEIGEIPLELQPKLLRVLQDHEFERLGGTRTIKVDLRLVAATNRDLNKSIASGHFRSDLFYRLNVFPIHVPALRERREDIPALVRHFVQKYARHMNRQIESVPTETIKALAHWHWPGNVRELENLIERSVILSEGKTLRVPLAEALIHQPAENSSDSLENAEREHIVRVLRETEGMISGPKGAAHKLGLKRTTLQSKMQRLGITRVDYKGRK